MVKVLSGRIFAFGQTKWQQNTHLVCYFTHKVTKRSLFFLKIGEIRCIRRKFCEENIEITHINYKQSNFQQTKSNKTMRLVCHFKHFYYLGKR